MHAMRCVFAKVYNRQISVTLKTGSTGVDSNDKIRMLTLGHGADTVYFVPSVGRTADDAYVHMMLKPTASGHNWLVWASEHPRGVCKPCEPDEMQQANQSFTRSLTTLQQSAQLSGGPLLRTSPMTSPQELAAHVRSAVQSAGRPAWKKGDTRPRNLATKHLDQETKKWIKNYVQPQSWLALCNVLHANEEWQKKAILYGSQAYQIYHLIHTGKIQAKLVNKHTIELDLCGNNLENLLYAHDDIDLLLEPTIKVRNAFLEEMKTRYFDGQGDKIKWKRSMGTGHVVVRTMFDKGWLKKSAFNFTDPKLWGGKDKSTFDLLVNVYEGLEVRFKILKPTALMHAWKALIPQLVKRPGNRVMAKYKADSHTWQPATIKEIKDDGAKVRFDGYKDIVYVPWERIDLCYDKELQPLQPHLFDKVNKYVKFVQALEKMQAQDNMKRFFKD